jgi:hypothetical protein
MYELSAAVIDLPPHDPEDAARLPRLPVLERWLARADRGPIEGDWRRWALRSVVSGWPEGDLPLGRALARRAGLPEDGTYFWLSPQHLIAGLASVHFDANGPVDLSPQVQCALVEAYRQDFGASDTALVVAGDQLLLHSATHRSVITQDPAGLAGRGLADGLPTGPDARWLRGRVSELELWLHDRGVRGTDGRLVNSFHAFGAGGAWPEQARPWPHRLAEDPGLAALAAVIGGAPDRSRAIDVCSFRALGARGQSFVDADAEWFAPLVERLLDGEVLVAHLWLHGRSFSFRASQRWRLWRRVRPWWESLA